MSIWSGMGMNYGHQFSINAYSTSQVENDFTYLKSQGINKIRIVFSVFDSITIPICKDMVQRAINHNFYVIWGVVAGPGTDATRWGLFKTYVTGTIAPWAQSVGLPELCVGNENELNDNLGSLPNATMRADTRSMATTIKSGGYTGKVSYSTAAQSAIITAWNSDGIGDLDLIGWNNYDTVSNFNAQNKTISSDFVSKAYISEFGSLGGGYSDFNNEVSYHHDTIDRIMSMKNNSIVSGYFFTYQDGGGFGVSQNTFGIVQPSGIAHLALQAVLGIATPFYGNFTGHA